MTDVMEAPAKIGHNNPPEPTPFDAVRVHIEDLAVEARNWLDGSTVASETDAAAVSKLMDMLRQAKKAADDARAAEKRPHDEAAKAVQTKYGPLLKTADLGVDACKAALSPWLIKLDQERQAAAAAARKLADDKAREAAAALIAARPTDLAAREQAEELATQAKRAAAASTKADKARPQATGGSRATTLRSSWEPVLVNDVEASKHYWTTRREAFAELLMKLAREDVTAGKRTIPGFDVREDRRVV